MKNKNPTDLICNSFDQWKNNFPDLKLIVIDTLAAFMNNSSLGQGYFKDHMQMNPIQQWATKNNIAILVLHHTRKAETTNPTDEASGTKGITAPGEANWVLKRERFSEDGKLILIGRSNEDLSYRLKFNKKTVEWEYAGEKIELNVTPERKEIIKIFVDHPGEELKTEFISNQLAKSQSTVSAAVRKLIKQGILVKGLKYSYYKLASDYEGRLTKDNF